MKAEFRDKLLQVIDRLTHELGRIWAVKTYDELISQIRKLLESETNESPMKAALIVFAGTLVSGTLGGPKEADPKFRSKVNELLPQIDTREKLARYLDDLPDSRLDAYEPLLQLMQRVFPILRKLFGEVAKALPHERGGRPRLIGNQRECVEICQRIGSFVTNEGLSVGQAQERVAQQKGVRKRTIERIWRARTKQRPSKS